MRLEQILTEDVSVDASIKTISDVLSTELPLLYKKLVKMAENFYDGHGELGKGFRFVSGGQKTQWYHDTFVRYLRPSLYNLAKSTGSNELKRYLNDSIGNVSFAGVENALLPILQKIAKDKKLSVLSNGVMAGIHARDAYLAKLEEIESAGEDDVDNTPVPPKQDNIGQQNVAVDNIINDVLGRLDRKVAGEVRNAIARSDNKLQALQQELTRRGIRM